MTKSRHKKDGQNNIWVPREWVLNGWFCQGGFLRVIILGNLIGRIGVRSVHNYGWSVVNWWSNNATSVSLWGLTSHKWCTLIILCQICIVIFLRKFLWYFLIIWGLWQRVMCHLKIGLFICSTHAYSLISIFNSKPRGRSHISCAISPCLLECLLLYVKIGGSEKTLPQHIFYFRLKWWHRLLTKIYRIIFTI